MMLDRSYGTTSPSYMGARAPRWTSIFSCPDLSGRVASNNRLRGLMTDGTAAGMAVSQA